MNDDTRFSTRHGFNNPAEVEITIRHEAPHDLRGILVDIAYDSGLRPTKLRSIVCKTLRKRQDENNWSEYPNIDNELRDLIDETEWYKVYDTIEAISKETYDFNKFERDINLYLVESGIGWKINNGKLETRNPEALEKTIKMAAMDVKRVGSLTAHGELHEAMVDLSRRPVADVTGSIQHAMAALECVMRDVTGNPKATLGELLKQYPEMIPAPLDQSVNKLWGFASEYGRHIREGRNPAYSEAQLVVGICASTVSYLIGKKNAQ